MTPGAQYRGTKVTDPGTALTECKTLMLDMDGTILDLAYDNYMWFEHIPAEYARRKNIDESEARAVLMEKTSRLRGKLEWYCLDHWSAELDLDVAGLHREQDHRIGFLPGAREFLETVVDRNVRLLLVTNSHRDTLAIKTEVTGVVDYFHAVYTSHEIGHAKEDQPYWQAVHDAEAFDPATTLFVDDNPEVLASARDYGIGMLLNVVRPDSRRPARRNGEFAAIESVSALL